MQSSTGINSIQLAPTLAEQGQRKWEGSTAADRGGILGAPDQSSASSWRGGGGRDSGTGGGLWPRPQPEGQTPAGPAQREAPPAAGLHGARLRALRDERQSRERGKEKYSGAGGGVMGAVQHIATELKICRAEKFIIESLFRSNLWLHLSNTCLDLLVMTEADQLLYERHYQRQWSTLQNMWLFFYKPLWVWR